MSVRPVERYGKPGRLSRLRGKPVAIGLGVLVAAAGVGVAALGYRSYGPQELEGKVTTTRIVDDSTMNLSFTLTRAHPDRAAVCIVRVRSRDGAESGRREVLIPAGKDSTVSVDTIVRSAEPPAVGELFGCGNTVPSYLKSQ